MKNYSVLLVDDDTIFSSIMKRKIERLSEGRIVVHCEGSKDGAIKYISENPCTDLLIQDISLLPGAEDKQGFDVAEQVKGDVKTKHIPIIFITNVYQTLVDSRLHFGEAHFTKPYDSRQLLKKIDSVLKTTAEPLYVQS